MSTKCLLSVEAPPYPPPPAVVGMKEVLGLGRVQSLSYSRLCHPPPLATRTSCLLRGLVALMTGRADSRVGSEGTIQL